MKKTTKKTKRASPKRKPKLKLYYVEIDFRGRATVEFTATDERQAQRIGKTIADDIMIDKRGGASNQTVTDEYIDTEMVHVDLVDDID